MLSRVRVRSVGQCGGAAYGVWEQTTGNAEVGSGVLRSGGGECRGCQGVPGWRHPKIHTTSSPKNECP